MAGQGIPHGEGEDNGVMGMLASVLALEQLVKASLLEWLSFDSYGIWDWIVYR